MVRWLGGGSVVVRWWFGGGSVVVRWWFGGGSVVVRWFGGGSVVRCILAVIVRYPVQSRTTKANKQGKIVRFTL